MGVLGLAGVPELMDCQLRFLLSRVVRNERQTNKASLRRGSQIEPQRIWVVTAKTVARDNESANQAQCQSPGRRVDADDWVEYWNDADIYSQPQGHGPGTDARAVDTVEVGGKYAGAGQGENSRGDDP